MSDTQRHSDSIESSLCLQGERVSFTGTLASMTHEAAHAVVEQQGGIATAHVSRGTTMLVVGEEGWPLEPDGKPSQKLEQVNTWREEGLEIRVIAESDWLRLVGLESGGEEVQRLYTAAMLSKLLAVPVGTIRAWERLGLVRPVRRVHRLMYFDFREVSGARRIAQMLEKGVPRREIQESFESLRRVLPDVERPLEQLEILASSGEVAYRDQRGPLQPGSGQRFLDFDPPADDGSDDSVCGRVQPDDPTAIDRTPEGWYREGCRLLDENETALAIEALRLCLMERPCDPEANFHLAESLYRQGNAHGALERYHAAVEADHNYIEAWTQLGCIHAELGEAEAACDAFRVALRIHGDYPDAHFHLADALQRLGDVEAAAEHWQAYLQFDRLGPWAEIARQRLEPGALREASAQAPTA